MSKLSKRLEKLENILNPPKPKKWVIVIQKVGETREQALSKAGVMDTDKVFLVEIVGKINKEQKK